MSIKPILFNVEMAKAILEGRKTVTRRAIKPQPSGRPFPMLEGSCWTGYFKITDTDRVIKPPYRPGDILWVRETWWQTQDGKFHYLADYELPELTRKQLSKECKARPSIHMPKAAARIFLRVTDLRAERLKDITDEQAMAEGARYTDFGTYTPRWKMNIDGGKVFYPVKPIHHPGYHFKDVERPDQCFENPRCAFGNYWNYTVKPADRSRYGCSANPWVWVIGFKQITKLEAKEAGWSEDREA